VRGVVPAGLRLASVFSVEGFVWAMEVSPHFLQGVGVYVLRVCVYAHTHTLHATVGFSDVSPGVGARHLERPEEIQMYCSDSIHTCGVRSTHVYVFAGLQVEVWTNCLLFSFNKCYLSHKRKEEDVSKPPIYQI